MDGRVPAEPQLFAQPPNADTDSIQPKGILTMQTPFGARTIGFDHVGLAVSDLKASLAFFCECLGWHVVGENPSYPAAFVTDGHDLLTLWQVEAPDRCVAFDRRNNIGLHHLALRVADIAALGDLHERIAAWPGVTLEFTPQLSGKGPKTHFMIREPSGIRIEFAFDPRI
jgi:catechol 2,3-dioxygenase-like lactoylglutathione lyase family enzyme